MINITTNILIDLERFKILNIKRKEKTGKVIGELITEEVKKNIQLITSY